MGGERKESLVWWWVSVVVEGGGVEKDSLERDEGKLKGVRRVPA